MNKHEQKRLEKLQDDAAKGVDGSFLRELTFPDLLLLLREHKPLRALIREIASEADDTCPEDHDADNDEADDADERGSAPHALPSPAPRAALAPVMRVAPIPADPLRQQLAPELALLQTLRADAELAAAWLGGQVEDEGRQLTRLVVCAAQWDLLSDLWEKLAARCKQAQRAASAAELQILRGALALHNLRWQGRQAQLAEVATGATYNYERHQRGTATGDAVRALWLPGLVNAGGQLHKKPLVQT